MSAQDTDIIMRLTISGRRFQVLIIQDGLGTWFGTISERADSQGHTQPLGSVETQDGPETALQGALDHILQAVGLAPTAARETVSAPAAHRSSANVGGSRGHGTRVDYSLAGGERQQKKTIRQWREQLGWSQPDLAGFLGLSQGLISRWERGVAIPPEPQQHRLARLFAVSVAMIVFGQTEERTETIDYERDARS